MNLMRLLILAMIVSGCFFSFGCEEKTAEKQGAGQAMQTRAENEGQAEEDSSLRFYNWEEYTGTGTIEKFKKSTGIEVELITFEDDEAIVGALQSGDIEADIIVVSQSLAREMLKAKLLSPIDYQSIPNSKYIKETYIPRADEDGKRYWVPYLWGTTGLVVNTKHIAGDYRTWSVLWDERYKGKIAMLNNPFEVSAAAAKMLGYSVNPGMEQLGEVRQKLLEQKDLVVGYFPPLEMMKMLEEESIWAAQIYSGDGLVVDDENDHIEYVIPREGTVIWVDVFIIPRNAVNVKNALKFIHFIHTPEVIGSIASEYWFASTNSASEQYMDEEVLKAEEVYPPENVMEKSEFFQEMGSGDSVRQRVKIWSELTGEK